MSQKWKPRKKNRASLSRKSFCAPLVVWPLSLAAIFVAVTIKFPLWYNNMGSYLAGELSAAKSGMQLVGQATRPASRSESEKAEQFVTKSGTELMVNGSSLRLIGYNWHWMGMGCPAPTDVEIDTTFALVKNASRGNVIRTAFYQSGSNNGAYSDFDRYIKYAKSNGLYIVPILANQLPNCEPSTGTKTDYWYQSGYKQPDSGYALSFRNYAIQLAQHYANESTIAFWQLVNEPDTETCGAAGAQILRNFADDMTTAIKAVDPHHLVDLGVLGRCAGNNTADYSTVVGGQVDLCDVWHDYGQVATPLPSQIQQRLSICQSLNKPSFVGESGICSDITADQTCSGTVTTTSLHLRATLFAAKLKSGLRAGLAGYMIWNKADQSDQDNVGPGDPIESMMAQYASP